jgi:glyoxylase-like metal-dependent hydrolase (beta-lactamase superfamily II)
VVIDPDTLHAAIIDPVLDFEPVSGRTSTESVEKIASFVTEKGLEADWILETHVHADHLTASRWLKENVGGRSGIGRGITAVQETFVALFNVTDDLPADGSQFDQVFDDDATISIGGIEGRVMATPGHTPSCVTYIIGDACFTGDTLFMPDSGTARCDFPGGDAKELYASLHKILDLPGETRLFVCHDYGAGGAREPAWETTVAEQRENNIHIGGGTLEHDYVQMRRDRDLTLGLPRLIMPAVQVNIRAGHFPPEEANGTSYIKVPLDVF